jgi:YD repeat-containing protein
MAVASRYGIPRSQLLGREPEAVTEYEYNPDGRLVRSITTTEPRWLPEDVAWAFAWMLEQADRCPGDCGLPLSETTAMRDGEPVHSYRVPTPRVCRACEEKIKEQRKTAEKYGPDPIAGARIWEIEQVS